jgi:hypothetical protein
MNHASRITHPASRRSTSSPAAPALSAPNIVERLVGQGERVRVLDDFSTGSSEWSRFSMDGR